VNISEHSATGCYDTILLNIQLVLATDGQSSTPLTAQENVSTEKVCEVQILHWLKFDRWHKTLQSEV
jgi:hypothetical protein